MRPRPVGARCAVASAAVGEASELVHQLLRHHTILATALALLAAAPVGAAPPPSSRTALSLEAGSVAQRQLVALGRDIRIAGDARSDVAALNGSVEVSGHVGGQVIVLSGDAHVLPTGRIDGDIFALGGRIWAEPGAHLGGRSVSYPDASKAWLSMLEEPSLGLASASRIMLGIKLALLAAWAALLLLLFATSGREMLETAADVRREPFRNFFIGLVAILAFTLTAVFLSAVGGDFASVPLLLLLVLAATFLKLWGMVAVFQALGDQLSFRLLGRRWRPLNAASLGLVVLGALKFLPYVGIWSWTAASLIGIGAALSTKFGRREPWFELA
jgi:hypothetical protein